MHPSQNASRVHSLGSNRARWRPPSAAPNLRPCVGRAGWRRRMADGLLEAVRGLWLAEPGLGPKPLLAKLREQQPDLGAGTREVREALLTLKAEGKATEAAAAAPPATPSAFSAVSASRTSLLPAPRSGCCSRNLASSGLKPSSGSVTRSPRTASRRSSGVQGSHMRRGSRTRAAATRVTRAPASSPKFERG